MARQAPSPVWLQTRVSTHLILYLLWLHGAALLALQLADMPLPWRLAGIVLVLAGLAWQLRCHGWGRGSWAIRAAHWRADGSWQVIDGRGRAVSYPDCFPVLAEPGLILVQLRAPGRRRWLVLAGDSADAETLRQLRVRLRRDRGDPEEGQSGPLAGK